MERWFCFYFVFQLCVSAPFSSSCSCPVFRVVLYCRPSVSPSYGYVIGLIVPANSNLVPSGLDLRPERMSISVSCYYSFHAFLSFPFCFVLFFALFCPSFCSSLSSSISVVRIYHRWVPGVISLQAIRDGIPQLIIGPFPLRTGNAVLLINLFFFPSRCF